MYTPQPQDVPSEQTIEVMSDHFLLAGMNSPSAWVFCPTRWQEQYLGYDGSLQNGKILIIQYKRVQVNPGGSLRVQVNQAQFNTLRTNFPQGPVPYLFYAFSLYPTYQQLDAGFRAAGGPQFFANMRFVNIHALPVGCSSLNYSAIWGVRPRANGQFQPAVVALNGAQLVNGVIQCPYGVTLAQFETLLGTAFSSVAWRPATPNTSIFILAT